MGWLRDLMHSAEPPIDGYGELSRRALAHSEWPADTRPQARSLAALFSKLDRGIELEWLADREAVQRTLALVLACPLEAVQRALQPVRERAGTSGRLRFEDLPYARAFDFREEPLPPGIPERVLQPSRWGRAWWRAASGSGRSLAGQWLSARGLASFVRARSWSEAAPLLPERGPTFLELEHASGFDASDRALGRDGLCVAAEFGPPGAEQGNPRPFELVESPPLVEVLPALLEWIAARLPEDGAFDVAAARHWLSGPLAAGQLPTLGALLGAAGLLDAHGARGAAEQSLSELAAAFVNERLEQASVKGSAEAQWLKRHGFDVLVKLAESTLTSSDHSWDVARSRDEWIALIPAELQQSVDTEWVRWSLSRSGGQTTVRDLDRALRQVPPGAYRIIRALVDARLLRERPSLGLVVAPELLRHIALERARERLVHEASPFSWGECLLRPHAAAGLLQALYRRVASDDFSLIEGLLELDLQTQPALVVATEASLVCLGLRLLAGAEVPPEYLEGIWNEQLGCLVELAGELPRPRLLCFEGGPSCVLAEHAVWGLAALAVSEALSVGRAAPHPLLRPWGTREPAPELGSLLDAIYAVVLRPELLESEWAIEAFALGGRLAEHFRGDAAAQPLTAHALARPARWVRALLDGDLGELPLGDASLAPIELRALQRECELQRVGWPRMAGELWSSWHGQACSARGDALFGPASSCREQLWPHLPREVLLSCWRRWSEDAASWPFHCFGRAQWATFMELWSRHWRLAPECPVWLTAFRAMAEEWAAPAANSEQLLRAASPESTALLSLFWSRFPALMLTSTGDALARGDAPALTSLLSCAPASAAAELVRLLSEGLARRSTERANVEAARRWLLARISARGAEWRSAYAAFTELERRLARLLLARGA